MDKTLKKQLKKYLFMPAGDYIVGIIFFAVALAYAISRASEDLSVFGLALIVGVFFNFALILNTLSLNAAFKKYENAKQMDVVLSDFQNGVYLCNNAICLGEYVILGQYSCNIVTYGEIDRVYQQVTKKYGRVVRQKLCVQLKDRRTKTLCEFDKLNIAEEELIKVVQIIPMQNPYIKIGYK